MRYLVKPSGQEYVALQEFCRLTQQLRATPRSHVAYKREAWMCAVGNSLRVTFDRQVSCETDFSTTLGTRVGAAVTPFQRQVILELKFADRVPNWCSEMIRALGLVRGGAPKYAMGVYMLGEHQLSNKG